MPVDLLVLSAALLSGVFGGVHCVAMCGGIATSLSATRGDLSPLAGSLLLNLGRVGGYVLAGAIVGGLGGTLLGVVRIDGLANTLRLLVGLVMLVAAARLAFPGRLRLLSRPGRLVEAWLQPLRRIALSQQGPWRNLLLGMLWGWLPCGLSTTILVAAWFEASALHGAAVMFAFGLGTLPLMVGLGWSGAHFARTLARPAARGTAAALIAVAGLITMASPLLLQVPQLQPVLEALGCRTALMS